MRNLFTSQGRQRRRNVPPTLTIEQKCEIANSEYELMQQELKEDKKRAERIANTLRAVLEETDIRISELKKDAYEFKRDIVVGGENMRTGKTMAEKMTRYMEEKLRQRDSLIEKLRLKNATIKAQMNKVEAHLRQKEEMGDVLHYIDFHQLQIENKQYLSRIEERNAELLRLKTTTGKTVHTLNVVKQKLLDGIRDSNWLKNEISSRTAQLRAVQRDVNKTAADLKREQKAHCRLDRQQTEAREMPTTLDYVQQKVRIPLFVLTNFLKIALLLGTNGFLE